MAWATTSIEDFSGLTTITTGTPPSGFTSNAGTYRVRTIGPRLSTNPAPGRSMLVSQTTNYIRTSTSGNFAAFGWFMLDERSRSDDGSHTVTPCPIFEIPSQYNDPGPKMLVSTSGVWTPTICDYHSGGVTIETSGTPMNFGFNQWVFILFAYVNNEARWYYKLPGGSLTLWQDISSLVMADGKIFNLCTVMNGYSSVIGGNGLRWAGRLGLLGTASISSFADVAYQSTWVDPPTARNTWYCRRTGSGSADGTSYANAWSPSQMVDEINNWGIIPTATPWLQYGSAVATNIDVKAFNDGVILGTIQHAGDIVYIDGESAEVRMSGTSILVKPGCEGLQIAPLSSSKVAINFSTLLTTWTNVSGNVWKAAATATSIMLWENDKWLIYLQGATFSAITAGLTAATNTSFGCDGSFIYLALPDGTNPNSNGRVYEYGSGAGVNVTAASVFMHGFKLWKSAAYVNSNVSGAGQSAIFPLLFILAGLSRFENIDAGYGDKHCAGTAAAANYPTGSRTIIRNCTAFQASPFSMVGYGNQTAWVMYIDAVNSNLLNEILWDNASVSLNAGVVGSSAGENNASESGFYTHNVGTSTPLPLLYVLMRNCSFTSAGQSASQPLAASPYQLMNTTLGFTPIEGVSQVSYPLVSAVSGAGAFPTSSAVVSGIFAVTSPVAYSVVN